jgi:hypothetical protein
VLVFSLWYITESRLLLTNTPIRLPNLWTGNTRELQLRAGCRKFLSSRQCIKQANCEWKSGKCSRKALGCRRISNEGKCKANRNCEWRDTKCRRKSIEPGTGTDPTSPPTVGDITIPDSYKKVIESRLKTRIIDDGCFCLLPHVPCVKATVNAIGDFQHGGNLCACYTWNWLTLTLDIDLAAHSVCEDDLPHPDIPAYVQGGENCEWFNSIS